MRWNRMAIALGCLLFTTATCGPKSGEQPGTEPRPTAVTRPAPRPEERRPATRPAKQVVKTTLAAVGLDKTALDRSVKPCQDFYRFACGHWIDRTKIPSDRPRWMRSFSEIYKRNEQVLKTILEHAEHAKTDHPLTRALGSYYRACMDVARVNKAGLAPIRKLLRLAKRVRNLRSLQRAVDELHRYGIWVLFRLNSEQDFKDATQVIGVLDQGGLGLPDRDYYLNQDARSKKIRAAYLKHVERMLKLGGLRGRRAKRGAARVMAIETALAKISKTRVQRRDPKGMYHRLNRSGAIRLAPRFNWAEYFKALGHPQLTALNITAPKFFEGLNELLKRTKAGDWRVYLTWQILHATAPALPKKFVDEAFKLRQILTGQATERPRWKRCVSSTDAALGELLAQPFIKQRFGAAARKAVQQQVKAISKAFGGLIKKLAWFDVSTRTQALDKLAKVSYLIGYPDKWKDYPWKVTPLYGTNLLTSSAFELQRDLKRIGKPVDRGRWEMTPPTVNAYYHPNKNQMVFPAGILQPPFWSEKAGVAVNLGGMGMVVGHELTHGFDDQGSQFDGNGNLRNWWSAAVIKRFKKRTQCVMKQYGSFEAVPGVKLNGKLTAGENIADMGGVKLAFRAYRMLRAHAKKALVADGFNEDQQFFLSVAQIWCGKAKPAYKEMAAKVDPHSPARWRVNGSLMNTPEFAKAFGCKRGTPMNPVKRCRVW